MTKPTIAQLQQRTTEVFTAYNEHDVDKVLTFHADEVVLRQAEHVYRGKEEVAAYLREFFSAFPDGEFPLDRVEMMVSPDHKTMSLAYTFRGTQEGAFLGLPASGRRIEFDGVSISRLDGLLAREVTMHMDTYGYLVQAGVLPPADSLGFKAIALAEISLGKAREVLRV